MNKKTITTVVVVLVAVFAVSITAAAYDLTPADYIVTNFDEAVPEILTTFTISLAPSITLESLPLLDLFYSDNQMLAWLAALTEGPITTWLAVDSLTSHAFEKDGTPKKDRRLVPETKRIVLHLFFALE